MERYSDLGGDRLSKLVFRKNGETRSTSTTPSCGSRAGASPQFGAARIFVNFSVDSLPPEAFAKLDVPSAFDDDGGLFFPRVGLDEHLDPVESHSGSASGSAFRI